MNSQPVHLPPTFRALRHRNFRLWFFGQGLSLVGSWMATMAQQVLVYRLTGSAAALGIISAIGLIPLVPLTLFGGSLADRWPRRKIIIIAQCIMMCQSFTMAALTWAGHVRIWHVYLLAFILAGAQALDLPSRQAFVVDMVEGREDLTNAIALNSAIFNGARALGPALAGTLVAALGEGPAFLLDGLSFVAVIVSLRMMHDLPVRTTASASRAGLGGHMAEGFRYIFSQQTIVILISLVAVSAFLSMPYSTLMPVFGGKVLSTSAQPVVDALCGPHGVLQCQAPQALPLGILLTAVGIGAVIGALLVASLPNSAQRGPLLTFGNLAFPAILIGFALSRSFVFSAILLIGVGVSFVFQNSLANTLLQLVVPDEVRGRVMSVYTLSFQTMMRLGGLQAGLTADRLGAPFSVLIGGIVSLGYGLFIAMRYPKVRNMA